MKNETIKVTPCKTEAEWRAFVERCDDDLEMRMDAVAREVAKIEDLRFLGLTGPTCSGKTTAARKLTECLEEYGHRVHVISIDDFYFDKDHLHALAEENLKGEIDYDSEATIDIALLREKVESLLSCKETQLPRFDFQTGYRVDGEKILPEKNDVFLFEGIQILYPRVREILNRGVYKCIYIYPASAIEQGGELFDPNEIRLMRRLVRDSRYRNAKADFTFYLWQSVQMCIRDRDKVDLLFQLNVNEFRGITSLQLLIQDLHPSQAYEAEYQLEKERYEQIRQGGELTSEEDLIPTREDMAQVYTLLRREFRSGKTVFPIRRILMLLRAHGVQGIGYVKLKFIIRIMQELQICGVTEPAEDRYVFEFYFHTSKTNLEKSSILHRLKSQMRKSSPRN